ncbi:hypothetical protein ES705_19071 [subsurface metagenome]
MQFLQRRPCVIEWHREKYKEEYQNLVTRMNSSYPCVLFIGAGPSISIYGNWQYLINYVLAEYNITLTEEEKSYKVSFAPDILEKCRLKDSNLFYTLLRQLFKSEGKREYNPMHFDLLSLPIEGFITTNLDQCLIKAAQRLPLSNQLSGFCYYPEHIRSSDLKQRILFHIHGIVKNHEDQDTIESTIITKSDYDNGYPNNIQPFLWAAFNEVNIIFFGFSLRDPEVKKILEAAKDEQKRVKQLPYKPTAIPVRHFIFLPSLFEINYQKMTVTEAKQVEDDEDRLYFDTYNLRVIRYRTSHAAEEHTELNNIINNLLIATSKQSYGDKT